MSRYQSSVQESTSVRPQSDEVGCAILFSTPAMTDPNDDKPNDSSKEPRKVITFDPETDNVSEELVTAVATLNEADLDESAILGEFIDPDALDALIRHRAEKNPDGMTELHFTYGEYIVSIDADGTITLSNPETPPDK